MSKIIFKTMEHGSPEYIDNEEEEILKMIELGKSREKLDC